MNDWAINKPLGQCYGTGQKIEYGQEYFGALVQTEEGLQRRDFSAEYWESQKPETFCYWKTRLPKPGQKKQLFVDDQMLMAFFERLGKETEPEKVNFRFVLALILMRKRILKYEETRTDGDTEVWLLRTVGDRQTAEVINPHLDEEQIEQLSSQIGEILQTEEL